MTNQELETKLLEVLENKNFFDMILAAKDLEKEYKLTDFYKSTKMPMMDVIKYGRIWYSLNFDILTEHIQEMINNLSFEKIRDILDQAEDIFREENEEGMNLIQELKDLNIVK